MNPLISIIIPTYNRARLLPEAVESCLAQTYPNVEVLIVDDGSTDDTRAMVAGKLRGDWSSKVAYHHQPNGGASSAKNLGMRMARGYYLQFLDSDDLLCADKLSLQLAAVAASTGDVDCCLCYGRLGHLNSGWAAARRIGELYPDVAALIRRQCERTVHIMHTAAPLWRREFLQSQAAWREDLIVAEEWEYYIRLCAQHPCIASVAEDLFWVRAHGGEQLSKSFSSLKHSISFYRAIRSVAEYLNLSAFWIPPIRRGLLLRARTTYINLLKCASAEQIIEFEKWFLRLAWEARDLRFVGVIWARRWLGKAIFVKLCDQICRRHSITPSCLEYEAPQHCS